MFKLDTINRLRLNHLLQGMMFFYGIEQIFLNSFLHDSGARGYVSIAFTLSVLVLDIPMGIIADKIGRKRCLLASAIAQSIGLVVLGLSTTLPMYLVGSVLYGLYVSLYNGASQALLYDWLKARKKTASYPKVQGNVYAFFLIGVALANGASGFLAHTFGLRNVYFFSVIPSLLAFLITWGIDEAPIAKATAGAWLGHLREVGQEIRAHRRIIAFGMQFAALEILFLTVGEFGQIYILSFGISTVALGLLWAVTAVFDAAGQAVAYRLRRFPRLSISLFCGLLGLFSVVEHQFGIGLFWLVYAGFDALLTVAEAEVQDETSSHIRATMLSTVSFIANLIAVPVILLYTRYYQHHDIFSANRFIIVPVITVLLITLLIKPPRVATTPAPTKNIQPI